MKFSPKATPHIYLDEAQLIELEGLSALGYTILEMALYFNADEALFKTAAEDETSVISRHIRRGILASKAREELAILKAAEGGNISASQQISVLKRHRGFKISKDIIFGGFDNFKIARDFEDWIQGGCKTSLNEEEQVYLQVLSIMNDMDRKYGRKNTIAHFTKGPAKLSHSRASEMYDEAINLFNTDRGITKAAYRHRYADLLDNVALVLTQNLQGPKDAEAIDRLTNSAAKLRELDKATPPVLPTELYLRPVRYFSLAAADVGLAEINRTEVARQIDSYDIPESDKVRIRMDAMISQINIEEKLDELEEKTRS